MNAEESWDGRRAVKEQVSLRSGIRVTTDIRAEDGPFLFPKAE